METMQTLSYYEDIRFLLREHFLEIGKPAFSINDACCVNTCTTKRNEKIVSCSDFVRRQEKGKLGFANIARSNDVPTILKTKNPPTNILRIYV